MFEAKIEKNGKTFIAKELKGKFRFKIFRDSSQVELCYEVDGLTAGQAFTVLQMLVGVHSRGVLKVSHDELNSNDEYDKLPWED